MKALKKATSLLLILVMMMTALPFNPIEATEVDEEVSFKSTNSVGDLVMGLAESNEDQDLNNSDYYVSDLYIENGYANVELKNKTEVKLVVAIYETENFQMVGSGTTIVSAESEIAKVKIECNNWPQYYYVKAFLLSAYDLSPLCEEHTCYYYTKEYEKFLSKTIYDFDEEEVINLDNDPTNNFIVLADGARTVTATDVSNIFIDADVERNLYTIENPDSELLSLKNGGTLYYIYGEGEDDSAIIPVDKIEQVGTKAIVHAKDDASVEDLLQYVRIEKKVVTSEQEYVKPEDFEEYPQQIATQGQDGMINIVNIPEVTVGPSFTIPIGSDDNVLYGEVKLKAEVTFKLHFAAGIEWAFIIPVGVKSYIDTKLAVNFEAVFDVTVEGAKKFEKAAPGITIPIFAGIALEGDPVFIFEVTAALKLNFTASKKFGFTYKTGEGSRKIDESDGWHEPNFQSEIVIKAGFRAELAVEVVKIFEFGGSVEIGIKAEGKPFSYKIPADVKHLCPVCLSGKVNLYYVLELTAKIGVEEIFGKRVDWTIEIFKLEAFSAEMALIEEFYITNITGRFAYHEGSCPHIAYKVYFTVKDSNGNAISGANVGELTTDTSGQASDFFENNKTYTVTVSANEYESQSKTFSINGKSIRISITLLKEDQEQPDDPNNPDNPDNPDDPNNPDNPDDPNPDPGEGVKYKYDTPTKTLTIYGSGNMTNYTNYISGQPWASLRQTAEKIVVEPGVTSIGDNAFYQFVNVESVSIADTVTYIGDGAFYECDSLQKIELPDSVDTIAPYAFYGCNSLKTVDLGSSVQTIGAEAFCLCNSLSKIVIPASCTNVGENAFDLCHSLSRIDFENKDCVIYDSESTIYSGATIYGYTDSTAHKHAKKYGMNFAKLSKGTNLYSQAVIDTTEIYDSYAVTYSSCVAGSDYILLNVTGYGAGFELTTSNLEYIDQLTADASGKVSCNFIPRNFVPGSTTLLIGNFGNGTEAKIVTPKLVSTSVEIVNNPGVLTINYMEGIKLDATVISPVDGCELQWYVDGAAYTAGDTIIIEHLKNETDITVKLVDANGNPVLKDGEEILAEETIKVNAGFFQKIIAFFKFTLFGQVVLRTN